MNLRNAIAMMLVVVLACAVVATMAVAAIGAEGARRSGPEATSTYIPAPRVVLLRCVEEMGGFQCVEVMEETR